MSLFQGLFPGSAGQTSTLFSEKNVYRRQDQDHNGAIVRETAPLDPSTKKKRKLEQEEAIAPANLEPSEQPVKKKARKKNALNKASHTEAASAEPAAELQQPVEPPQKDSSGKARKKQHQESKKATQAATAATASAKRQTRLSVSQRKADKASARGTANGDTGAGKAVQEKTGQHDNQDSETDEEELQAATGEGEGEEGTTAAAAAAEPAKRPRTEEEKAERLRRTIFVGNLPVKVKAKLLKQTLSQYGAVESVRLRSLPLKEDAKLPRRAAVAAGAVDEARGSANAYVVFESGTSAVHALAHNMRELEGRHIRVDRAAAVSKGVSGGGTQVLYDSARSVFVGNLPFDTQDEELIELFGDGKGGPGNVTAVRVVRDAKTSVGKGIAFVEFSGRPAARMAMAADGRVLRGRQIRVTRVAKTGAAAAAAADAAAAGSSRLRTPFSRGVKVGKLMASGPRKGVKAGKGEGKPRAGGQAAWQGMRTKGQKKVIGGFAAKEREVPAGGSGKPSTGGTGKGVEGKPKGKRPSVAARKEKLLTAKKQKRT